MSQILVRNLDPEVVDRLKLQAKQNKRSLEAEVRDILEQAARGGHTAEYRRYVADIASGRDKRAAFSDFLEARQRRPRSEHEDSAELIRMAREELDAKWR